MLKTYIKELRMQADMMEQLSDKIGELVYVRDHIHDIWSGPHQLLFIKQDSHPFGSNECYWRFAKLAKHTTRHVIANRRKLVEVLLEQGYMPDEEGAFVHDSKTPEIFQPEMWALCGDTVNLAETRSARSDLYTANGYYFHANWTELMPEED